MIDLFHLTTLNMLKRYKNLENFVHNKWKNVLNNKVSILLMKWYPMNAQKWGYLIFLTFDISVEDDRIYKSISPSLLLWVSVLHTSHTKKSHGLKHKSGVMVLYVVIMNSMCFSTASRQLDIWANFHPQLRKYRSMPLYLECQGWNRREDAITQKLYIQCLKSKQSLNSFCL